MNSTYQVEAFIEGEMMEEGKTGTLQELIEQERIERAKKEKDEKDN